jgi:hypothetical protein
MQLLFLLCLFMTHFVCSRVSHTSNVLMISGLAEQSHDCQRVPVTEYAAGSSTDSHETIVSSASLVVSTSSASSGVPEVAKRIAERDPRIRLRAVSATSDALSTDATG